MRKIWKLLPHFIVEWIAVNYGEVIELQNQIWYVISYKNNLGNTFLVRNKEVEQSKSCDNSDYYVESSILDDSTCNTCGSKTVEIRGRTPNDIIRRVCPTCAVEKLENYEEQQALENWLPSKIDYK